MKAKVKLLVILLCVIGFCVLWGRLMSPYVLSWEKGLSVFGRCVPRDHPWFVQRFNKSFEPFLSVDDNLSEDTFNWWKHLQVEARDFSTFRKTVDGLFQMFLSGRDVKKSSPHQCRTCAVVGNSGNLRKSHYGPLIDFHDVIIRMNQGRIEGYENDVGSRTTHRIMYPESAVDLDNTTHLVLVPFKIMDLEWVMKALSTGFSGRSYAPIKSHIKANKDLVLVINPAFMRYVHDKWLDKKGSYPSTGFLALLLALHICDEVNVFGYGADSDGNWSHYWEKLQNSKLKTGVHPGDHEYRIIQELAKQQKLTFYKGW